MGCCPTALRYRSYSRTGDNCVLFDCDERNLGLLNGIIVAMGGAIGAVLRYLIGLLPLNPQNGFPLKTFCINVIGAFAIGLVAALSARASLNPRFTLFLKVEMCGGFTTFSSFALETETLLGKENQTITLLYVVSSLVCGVLAVAVAESLV